MFLKQMTQNCRDSGPVVTIILIWVRISGPVCNVFFVTTYIPHKYRTGPQASDIIEELVSLLWSKHVCKNDCVIIVGDLNCQLRRNAQGYIPWTSSGSTFYWFAVFLSRCLNISASFISWKITCRLASRRRRTNIVETSVALSNACTKPSSVRKRYITGTPHCESAIRVTE